MKFFTHLNIDSFIKTLDLEEQYHRYTIHHMYFYLSLLSREDKIKLLSILKKKYKESYLIFNRILNIENSFCENINDCDYVVIPCDNISISINPRESLLDHVNLIKKAKDLDKKILFFYGGDNDKPIKMQEISGIVFRNSGFLSEHNANVFGCPTFNKFYKTDLIVEKTLSVSFCGSMNKMSKIKKEIIEQLSKYSYFDFKIRDQWGGGLSEENIKIFYENLKENLYSLCVRGGGNFSFRLGETFMMGRIPVLIDTDCILPFKEFIPYKENTVYVTKENSKNFTDIDSVIQEYHNSHTMEELIEIQKENVKIWYNYFTVDNAFNHTCKILENIKNGSR
jgi:hypothetical protein